MNVLIIGGGSKFGMTLRQTLLDEHHHVWAITGQSASDTHTLTVDWNTCGIQDFEKFLRQLPNLDLVVFNQNSCGVSPAQWHLAGTDILEIWRNAMTWKQNHYLNCVMPTHVLHTLHSTNKLHSQTRVVWMLSLSMFGHAQTPPDYMGQKYQNFVIMKTLAKHNDQIYLGICPGHLNPDNARVTAKSMIDLCTKVSNNHSGQLYVFDSDTHEFKPSKIDFKIDL